MSTYVLDTSVILSSGKRIFSLSKENKLVIPLAVIKEIESKRSDSELGYIAREFLNALDELQNKGDIKKGVKLDETSQTIRVEINHTKDVPEALKTYPSTDTRILTVAYALASESNEDVILLTKDTTMRILATIIELKSANFDANKDNDSTDFTETQTLVISKEDMDILFKNKRVRLDHSVPMNTGVVLTDTEGGSALAIARTQWNFDLVDDKYVGSYTGKNKEQKIASDHLMNNDIGVVSLSGVAGSGKSFWMLNAALALVEDKSTPYERIVVFRPVNPVGGAGQDLGFLPGDMNEKLAPHMQAVYDTLGTIKSKTDVEKIKRNGTIEFASISHVRGRTLANCIVICDELQNVESSTILTLITRLGINARLFMGWDTAQLDAKYIGKYDGIYKIVQKLRGNKLFAHITFKKSERSAIAEMATKVLDEL